MTLLGLPFMSQNILFGYKIVLTLRWQSCLSRVQFSVQRDPLLDGCLASSVLLVVLTCLTMTVVVFCLIEYILLANFAEFDKMPHACAAGAGE